MFMEGEAVKTAHFTTWLAQLNALNRGQKERLRSALDRRENAAEVIRLIEQGLQEKPLCLLDSTGRCNKLTESFRRRLVV